MRLPLRQYVQSDEPEARDTMFARIASSFGARNADRHAESADPLTDRDGLLADFEISGQAWFWAADSEGKLVYLTPRFARELGIDPAALHDVALSDLILHEEVFTAIDTGSSTRTLGFHFNGRTGFSDVAVRSARDPDVWWSLTGRPLLDAQGCFAGFRGFALDLSGSRRADAEIARLAHYDSLTGLPNRVLMRRTLQGLLTSEAKLKGQGDCGLFMLDLDRFKSVNDTLGHPVGDELLKQVAQRLTRVVGDLGCVCRLGGDEFTVVVPDVRDRDQLAQLADAIIKRLSFPYTIDTSTVSIGASVGIAISPFDGDCADELLRNADLALYDAKGAGRGIHSFYQPQMHSHADDRRLIEDDLREALAEDQLRLMYQPVVDLESSLPCGFEALVRWEHPERGDISPALFVPIAEEIGLMPALGDWVMRTALDVAANWPEGVRIAINLSPLQFRNPNFAGQVTNALAAAGVSPDRLELELTEGIFAAEEKTVDAMFATLKKIGVRFRLDDFGTGYASLAHLKRFPFDSIKIDRSFVRGLSSSDSSNIRFVTAIVALAESLGMQAIAEGAETTGEVDVIRSLGCTRAQGHIFGKPVTAEEATALVAAHLDSDQPDLDVLDREPRIALFRKGKLHSDGRTHPVRVRNISVGGALIEIDPAARLCNAVDLELGPGEIYPATVRWSRDRRVGIAFSGPIDLAIIVRSAEDQ
jgi:diguanylate cyclase (GGDEF)-like protein